jgi:hypothetical protein
MTCTASVFGPQDNTSSSYAEEGTAAHALAAECWVLGSDPAERIGQMIENVEVTEEMAQGVQIFLDALQAAVSQLEESAEESGAKAASLIELFMEAPGVPEFGGTADAVVWLPKGSSLHVIDFKYGAGVTVEAENNPQLLCYAWLAVQMLKTAGIPMKLETVTMTVVQPRREHAAGPIRSSTVSVLEVEQFGQKILDRIEILSNADEGVFAAGDHCRWCPRKVHCPKLYELTIENAKKEFSMDAEMTPERAAELMGIAKIVNSYLDAVGEWAHGQMEKGVTVPGFKLVHAFSNRAYCVEESEILKRLKKLKVAKSDAYVTTLKSPAQLEKVTGKEFVNSVCDRALKGTTVVPLSDNRPAVDRKTAADEFANVEQ